MKQTWRMMGSFVQCLPATKALKYCLKISNKYLFEKIKWQQKDFVFHPGLSENIF